MARPREHDLDQLLDHARALWVEGGRPAVTVRALSARSGASNGSLYHAFGSRDGLLARVWAREASRFLAFQRAAAEAARATGTAADAMVAAALAPAGYAAEDEHGARLLLSATGDDLATGELAAEQRDELARLRVELGGLITELAGWVWGAADSQTVQLARHCVVDLPSALLLAESRTTDQVARRALESAVRGIVTSAADRAALGDGRASAYRPRSR